MRDGSDPANDANAAWERAPEDTADVADSADSVETIDEPTSAGDADTTPDDGAFTALLCALRALPGPCAPPIGEGAFDILYASAQEIVVWFVSAKDGVEQHEVAIPAWLARRAWGVMLRGEPVDEAALRAIASGPAGGRWLLALFAQLPTVEVRSAPASSDASDASQAITLLWRGERRSGKAPRPLGEGLG